ncbi:MAG: PfkB family carbohydrate kinase [Pirellulaceae bacterium]|nr:carbohydrate kinase [Planctomycetales bacterium]
MTPERLEEILARFGELRIGVLGDFFLDAYLEVDPELAEPSVETGKVAHQVVATRSYAGAAGTIVNNLSALGVGRVWALGALGDDGPGWELRRALKRVGCNTDLLLSTDERMTPVYLKPHDRHVTGLAGEHSRYDTRNRTPTSDRVVREVLAAAEQVMPELDALIVLDQVEHSENEIVTPDVRVWVSTQAARKPGPIVWVDSRFHVRSFPGAWIKPNQFESCGERPTGPESRVETQRVVEQLPALRAAQGAPVTVTLGERGLIVSDPQPTWLPAYGVTGPIDTTGAGDSVTAAMVAGLCAKASHREAGWLGNLAASLTIQQLGTTGVATPRELLARLGQWRDERPSDFA